MTDRIPIIVTKDSFAEIEKKVRLSSHTHTRAGIFPFWEDAGKINVILGRDKKSKLFTNLAGHVNLTEKGLFEEMNRECEEETLGLLTLDEQRMAQSETYFSVCGIITFYKLTTDEAKKLLDDFQKEVKTKKSPEIDKLETVTWDNFWQIIRDNDKTELVFRPISFILCRAIRSNNRKIGKKDDDSKEK